ncbi:histidine phosphatase family protein [Neptunicoccus cionae]|uniref:Histidine phosphatase family protein n=1 Tax=Neptunicoccus cionae TaxID=2035344 RepID=A0A916QTZ1_9RHOB|nr:histidine phosphatase family protein [Amylibacter cionae]GGA13526.1 histidine phosphatase family protein [Amylibacter cionae]
MAEIIMVRHGQAQTGAKDEASYDNLSDLGHQQARWLGEHLDADHAFDRVVTGTMRRQMQTGLSMGLDGVDYQTDARLNEMDYFGLAGVLETSHGLATPTSQEEFQTHVAEVLGAWSRAEVGDDLESYADFRGRILGAVRNIAQAEDRVIVVSSTGVIATLMAVALDLDIRRKSEVFLRIAHTSVHKFEMVGDDLHLLQFCATPHLDSPERVRARTLI